jgi:hypothetical protein
MERFEHLAMVAFLILGLAMVRLMVNVTSLMAKDTTHNKNEDGHWWGGMSLFYRLSVRMSVKTIFGKCYRMVLG